MLRAALLIIAKNQKKAKSLLTDEWGDKMCHIHTTEHILPLKMNEKLTTDYHMDEL